MRDETDPLHITRSERSDGLVVARQAPPASSVSFSATYLAPAGYAYDPRGSEGTALLASQLIASGAGRRDRVELARELDRRGATLHTRCDPESAQATIWGPMDSFRPLLDLLADVVLRPRFHPKDLARVRRQLYERQLREQAQPESRAERELFRAIYSPGHPYRLTGVGTRQSAVRIGRANLISFHRAHYTSEGALVVVTAPRSLSEIRREVDRRFRDFAEPRAPAVPRVPSTRGPPKKLTRIGMPGRTQVEIRVGGPSIARSSPYYAAAYLANELLGGRPLLGRLFQKVRETHGLAYHASSEFEPMRWGGHWFAQAGTGPERVGRVTPMLVSEIERIAHERARPGELNVIRESSIGEIPLGIETTAGAHELALDVVYHGLSDDFYRTWPTVLRALRPEEVRRGAEEALDGRGACTVIVGPES